MCVRDSVTCLVSLLSRAKHQRVLAYLLQHRTPAPRCSLLSVAKSGSVAVMTSQVNGSSDVFEWSSLVRGHHEYHSVWTPRIGEILLLKRQRDNLHDPFAVGVMKGSTLVGHVPLSNSRCISLFLSKVGCSGFCEVTGNPVNRGAGFGLEVPCIYRFYGPTQYIKRLQDLVK